MQNSPSPVQSPALEVLANLANKLHQNPLAIIERGPDLYRRLASDGDPKPMAECILLQAMARHRLGRREDTEDFIAEWEETFEELNQAREMVRMLNLRGLLAKGEHNYKQAIAFFRRGLELTNEPSLRAGFCGNLGRIFKDLGDYGAASDLFLEALNQIKNSDRPGDLARTYTNLADVCHVQDQHELALRYLDEAQEQAVQAGIIGLHAEICLYRARTLEKLGRQTLQRDALEDAARLADASPDIKAGFTYQRYVVQLERAKFELRHGDTDAGVKVLRELSSPSGELNDREAIDAHLTLARHSSTGAEEAVSHFEAALALALEIDLRAQEAQARAGLAQLLQSSDPTVACEHLTKALQLERTLYSEESARRLQAVGLHRETSELQEKLSQERRVREETARLLAEVEKQKTRAQEADRAKTAILGIAAHDLSNQLGALVLGVKSLQVECERHAAIAPWRDDVHDLDSAATELRELLRRLLDYSAIQKGTLSSRPEETDLIGLVKRCVEDWQSVSAAKAQTLSATPPLEAKLVAHVDPARLAQVLHNLISNALKYAPRNTPVEVVLKLFGDSALIEVADRGPGIDPADQPQLFQAFRALSNRPTGGESSTGLGLHIARAIIENEGGQIGYLARPGGGSMFWLTVPLIERVGEGEGR